MPMHVSISPAWRRDGAWTINIARTGMGEAVAMGVVMRPPRNMTPAQVASHHENSRSAACDAESNVYPAYPAYQRVVGNSQRLWFDARTSLMKNSARFLYEYSGAFSRATSCAGLFACGKSGQQIRSQPGGPSTVSGQNARPPLRWDIVPLEPFYHGPIAGLDIGGHGLARRP